MQCYKEYITRKKNEKRLIHIETHEIFWDGFPKKIAIRILSNPFWVEKTILFVLQVLEKVA